MVARQVGRLALVIGVLVLLTLPAGAQAAPGGVDRLFGHNGFVDLSRAPAERFPSLRNTYAIDMMTGPGGAIFVLSLSNECATTCERIYVVTRYRPDGSVDSGYGDGGSALLSFEVTGPIEGLLAVDAHGRASVGFAKEGTIEIARLTANGSRDASFGGDGEASVTGVSSTYARNRLFVTPGGRYVLESDWTPPRHSPSFDPRGATIVVSIARLLPGGGPDRAFGKAGRKKLQLHDSLSPQAVVAMPSGAVVLAGTPCCPHRGRLPYVAKVRADGSVDRRFAPLGNLRRLSRAESIDTRAILLRSNGRIDLAGSASWGKSGRLGGFLIRLRGDGRPYRRFGSSGVRLSPWALDAAALDRRGRVFGVANQGYDTDLTVFRLTAGGRIDRTFGRGVGVQVPGASGGEGGAVAAYSGSRPIVFNDRSYTCRESCPGKPVMVAFRGGS